MKQPILLTLFLLLLIPSLFAAPPPRTAEEHYQRGLQNYEQGDFAAAADDFRNAQKENKKDKLPPGSSEFNLGDSLYQIEKYDEAENAFRSALRTPDLKTQSQAYYNLGNTYMTRAQKLQTEGKLQPAQQSAREAIGMYRQSLLLDERDTEAKQNYELALQLLQQVQQQQQQQKQQSSSTNAPPQDDPSQQNQQEQQKQDSQPSDPSQNQDPQQNQSQQEQSETNNPSAQNPTPTPDPSSSSNDTTSAQQANIDTNAPPEDMTPQEALLLLNAQKEEEQQLRERMRLKRRDTAPVDKDW